MGDDLGERHDFAGRGTGVDLHRQFSRRRRVGDEMVYSKGGAAGFRLRQLEAEYEDFAVGLEKQQSGTWDVEFYENRQMELCMWLFEDKVLFCFPSDIAKGVCEEAPNRDAATFDPEVMRTMEARIVPYIEPEDIGGPSEEVGP